MGARRSPQAKSSKQEKQAHNEGEKEPYRRDLTTTHDIPSSQVRLSKILWDIWSVMRSGEQMSSVILKTQVGLMHKIFINKNKLKDSAESEDSRVFKQEGETKKQRKGK
jgi:hypothetical protein